MVKQEGIEEIGSVNCSACSGTGMGQVEWVSCRTCRGAGVVLDIDVDDRADRDLDRAEWRREMDA